MVRLIEVVLPRLGISKEHVSVSFSGSKGYHVRVLTPATFKLTRDQRRQIQEFVAGHSLMDLCNDASALKVWTLQSRLE